MNFLFCRHQSYCVAFGWPCLVLGLLAEYFFEGHDKMMKQLSTTAVVLLSLTHHVVYVSSFHTPQPHAIRRRSAAEGGSTQQHSRGPVHPGLLPTSKTQYDSSCSSSTALFGIPKMFRWLTDQYPNILNRRLGSAQSIPPIDNFYLDMNGIIHPCTHGNNEDEIVSHSLYCSSYRFALILTILFAPDSP